MFRHLLHGLEVELRVIEQRQLHLLAHRGHVSLAEQKLGRAAPAIAALGVRQFQRVVCGPPIVRRTGPPRIGSGWVSFLARYAAGNMPLI